MPAESPGRSRPLLLVVAALLLGGGYRAASAGEDPLGWAAFGAGLMGLGFWGCLEVLAWKAEQRKGEEKVSGSP
jgi:hypothetical protein